MNTESLPFVILLAEDEPADAHLVKTALAENRILTDLHHVVDGREVLEFLRRQGPRFANAPRPDLILLDLNMPRMDGRECLAALKQDPALHGIPVVILTTSKAEEDILRSYNLHANCYITKPMDLNQFFKVVQGIADFWFTIVKLPPNGAKS